MKTDSLTPIIDELACLVSLASIDGLDLEESAVAGFLKGLPHDQLLEVSRLVKLERENQDQRRRMRMIAAVVNVAADWAEEVQ